jgi:uncharacterized protein
MSPDHLVAVCLAVLVIAFLFASVGQAGASGYIAVMALFSFAPETIRPTALALTILVALVGSFQFWRAGHVSWRLLWPLVASSVPCAFVGGYLHLPARILGLLLGGLLLYAAGWLFVRPPPEREPHHPALGLVLPVGAVLGFVAGLTGTGAGIFLTPIMIFLGWSSTKTAAALSTFFILVNAVAGLLGNLSSTRHFPTFALAMAVAAVAGGAAGSYLGSRRFPPAVIKRLLAVVLAIAGLKLVLG